MKNEHTVTKKIDKKKWSDAIDKAFNKKNKEVQIKGFRKGKAPKEVFIKNYGIEVLFQDAIDLIIPEAYDEILKEEKLEPVVKPSVDIKNVSEDELELVFKIITKPEIKMKPLKDLGVKQEKPKVTKEEVNTEIDNIRKRYAELIIKENGEVEKGDIAVIDYEGFVNNKAFDGGKAEGYELEIGSNTFIPGFEDGLIGMKKGESKDINVKFPDNYSEELSGKDAVFKIKLHEIKMRKLPDFDEEFLKDLGYNDIKTKEEFEKEVKANLLKQKEAQSEDKYINDLIGACIDKMEVEINQEIIDEELDRIIHDLEHNLSHQGINLDLYLTFIKKTKEDLLSEATPEAIKRIQSRYVIDYIIENEKLEATDEEVNGHVKKLADMYGIGEEELIQDIGGLHVVKYDLLVHKAIDYLKTL